jgi:ribose 1,5-bisphosphate isomerase
MDYFERTVSGIRSLEIQGATNVAKAALKALETRAARSRAKSPEAFLNELKRARAELYATRPTEPMMRNSLRYVIDSLSASGITDIRKLKQIAKGRSGEFLKKISRDKQRIAEIGAGKIENGATILTHCHSSATTGIFKQAKKEGKRFSVVCLETRPNYQGRITARELVKAKVPTTMIVDSAVSTAIKKCDAAFVGADVITSDVSLINKVGTLMVSLACKRIGLPFYCATELVKYDPETLLGKTEVIEHRPGKEVWPGAPKGLNIDNPVFDITPRENISAFITEEGIVPPAAIPDLINEKLPWLYRGLR